MPQPKPLPPVALLRELFDYDPVIGEVRNKVRRANSLAGALSGNKRRDGYIIITLNYVRYSAHRLAWKIQTGEEPPVHLDHKDRNPSNNAFSNLRASDPWSNQGNRKPGRGRYLPGTKRNGNNRWAAKCVDGHIGQFDTEKEAHQAYVQWHLQKFGEFSIYAP